MGRSALIALVLATLGVSFALYAGCLEFPQKSEPEPRGVLSLTSLDFGDVPIGQHADSAFTITNVGGGTLDGDVKLAGPSSCFSIVSGAGFHSLDLEESTTVVVRFQPVSEGPAACTVETGEKTPAVAVVGGGERPHAGLVAPDSLGFGTVEVGHSLDLTFVILSVGSDTLTGTVTEGCDHFGLVGSGDYSLPPGESGTFTVRFGPGLPGTHTCVVETGHEACVDVACAGEGYSESCSVSPALLDFGAVEVGEHAERTFEITNTGSLALSGTVSEESAHYSLVGETEYSLSAGESQAFTVRFGPGSPGTHTCVIATGNDVCGHVSCSGEGYTTSCSVAPPSLDFGTVVVGEDADLTFEITNTGTSLLSGVATEACEHYSLAGDASYSLPPGESEIFTVRFSPTSGGIHACTIETGIDACGDVTCVGDGCVVSCSLSVGSLEFGAVEVGRHLARTFAITNTGTCTLGGVVSEDCDHFSLVGGTGYHLSEGESETFTVRFEPGSPGTHACVIETGNGACTHVECSGTGYTESCSVTPGSLDFESVEVGEYVDLTFEIENTGTAELSGTVSEGCDHFSLVAGTEYSLSPGASETFTVRFEPESPGTHTCEIETGNGACVGVDCTGSGHTTACLVVPGSLDFGSVEVGESVERTFEIANMGTVILNGAVSEVCEHYSLVGSTSYSIAPDESQAFTVRFAPTSPGSHACTIETGNNACVDVDCTGEGYAESCAVTPSSLDFGTVSVGEDVDLAFEITNTGTKVLTGMMSEASEHFSLLGNTSYNLSPGETRILSVRFSPTTAGTHTYVVETGNGLCVDVSCTGVACEVWSSLSTTSLEFGVVKVGEHRDLTFRIENTGTCVLSGTISEGCDHFCLVGSASYDLSAGESQTFTVRFEPGSLGTQACVIETGNPGCADVSCAGQGAVRNRGELRLTPKP